MHNIYIRLFVIFKIYHKIYNQLVLKLNHVIVEVFQKLTFCINIFTCLLLFVFL